VQYFKDTFAKMHCCLDISSQYTSSIYANRNNNWEHEEPKPNKGDPLEPWAQKCRNRGGTSKIDSPRRIADSLFQANILARSLLFHRACCYIFFI
jgi:hypothetical protein